MSGDAARTESGTRAGHDLRGIILFTLVAAFLVGALIVVGFLGRRTSAGPSRLEAGRAGALSAGHGGDS